MVKYFCDVCGKEINSFQENSFLKTFNDNVKQDELIDSFSLILAIDKFKLVERAYVCEDCFIKYVESALKQMKKEIASDVAEDKDEEFSAATGEDLSKATDFLLATVNTKEYSNGSLKRVIKYMHEQCNIEFYEFWYAVKDYVKLGSMLNWFACEEKKYKCKYVKANPIEEITKETLSSWVDGYLKSPGGIKALTNRTKEN